MSKMNPILNRTTLKIFFELFHLMLNDLCGKILHVLYLFDKIVSYLNSVSIFMW